jgi:exosortase
MRWPLHPLARTDLARGAWIAAVCALVFALFHFFGVTDVGYDPATATRSAFVWLGRRWRGDLDVSWFASGHLIPVVTLLLVWSRRRELRAAVAERASGVGLACVALALALHWVGARAQQTRLSLAAFALLAWAIPFYAGGGRVARVLAFPCLFLLLAIPLNFMDGLARPLRYVAVHLSALLLSGLGLNVDVAGSLVYSRVEHGFRLELADHVSGIYPAAALAALVLATGFLRRWSTARFAATLAALPVVIVLANTLRTVVFGLAGEAFGGAATAGAFARWSPSLFLLAALAGLAGLSRLRRVLRAPGGLLGRAP